VSKRDDALAALHACLGPRSRRANPAPQVLRDASVPQRLPAGGLVVVRDGGQVESTAILSPLSWVGEHRADVEVVADGTILLDALLVEIGDAVLADRTLGGTVDWAQPGAPDVEEVEFEGAAPASAASVPISLFFTAAGSPLA
jgi:hypothetical protein